MPQPVDLQTELARLNAADRLQQAADRASIAALQRAAQEDQQTRLQTETTVQQTQHAESEQVRGDEKRKNPFVGRRRKRHSNANESESPVATEHPPDLDPHNFDVMV